MGNSVPHYVGLDIGGANLKAAHADGRAVSRPFAVWKAPERLAPELRSLLAAFAPIDYLAVTMTAELADCYETKSEGVRRILGAVRDAASGVPVHVWTTSSEFVPPEVACETPILAAAANWHALATWAAMMAPAGLTLLIDIGTTTTDVVPIVDGFVAPRGLTDCERLLEGELVYTGIRRTPLCALDDAAPFRGARCPLAAELFATTHDVYLMLGDVAEAPEDCETANGRPSTKAAARDRLARMLCCDRDEFDVDDAMVMARHFAAVQRRRIAQAIDRVVSAEGVRVERAILSGSGAFLVERIVREHPAFRQAEITRLADVVPREVAEAACAFAVARLAAERVF